MTIVVTPALLAIQNGWDEIDRFEWPGTLVAVVEKPGKTCFQFLIWDNQHDTYAMKCWNRHYLQTHDLQGDEWNFTVTGFLPNVIAEESLPHGRNSNNCGKDARSSKGYRGKRTKKRRR
ncbi:TPA: hypothetical protein R5O69_004403 [Enterobacter hormaechei]|nr:hypothetical protein [Enterobacter hormaechei]HED5802433.1 hypothetical protein [Enterobacter hormaechei]HED5821783.1 hypothetical protein [Enterobacter hormaechei]